MLRQWAGRRQQPILGYISKTDEKIIHAAKGEVEMNKGQESQMDYDAK